MSFRTVRWLSSSRSRNVLGHKPLKSLSFKESLSIWWKSLSPNRLEILQKELVDLMIPTTKENSHIQKGTKKVHIGDSDHINEVEFKIVNGALPTKHLVFIHGYGASLGCFARNFQLIDKFKSDPNYNYHVHFLDNITFGLSSNPKIDNAQISWRIPPTAKIKLIDNEPTTKLYRKYYKLIEGYQLDPASFAQYRSRFKPILQDMEKFYTSAIEQWRQESGIPKIDCLIGHSFGGYWSASYALLHPEKVTNLILLSPVGLERHVMAITNDEVTGNIVKPVLDPTSYRFLSRFPILSMKHVLNWYYKIPFLPRLLPYLGPWGAQFYFRMWLPKLSKINRIEVREVGSVNDKVYGSPKEVKLIVEYLYNSASNGTNSDIYVKYLLTPATVSKWPLYDKFINKMETNPRAFTFNTFLLYGQYDFMNSEAGQKLVERLSKKLPDSKFRYGEVAEGGHNLYIDNPFDTNRKIYEIATKGI
ncbi:hypothetical protein KGF57_002690 [Candida theae]|uniref:AB hydrolase-1 domain-containing protein n=1 Tax=Candida theae TaxID=1198502 RepID=A0AAD5FYQ6_9ASCO|nr:uncharacterized protein KGF57_002690 [Candida theae]KAI5958334.1 hypothetical protein KGF57_002690 [Candida theae]